MRELDNREHYEAKIKNFKEILIIAYMYRYK